MKGFLKRDFYHLMVNARFYLLFLAAVTVLAVAKSTAAFLFLYIVVFCSSALMVLFTYDTTNHWQAYAAAMPNGRRAQVDGRYALGGLMCLGMTALMAALSLLVGGSGDWQMPLLFGGSMLIYVDLLFPLSYRFGDRSRLVLLIILAVLAGAAGGTMVIPGRLSGEGGSGPLGTAAVSLALIGLAGLAVSHRVSVAIMAKKDL